MLAWCRKQQTLLTPLILAVFLGSLFALFCQRCLRQLEQEQHQVMVVKKNQHEGHCAHSAADTTETGTPVKEPEAPAKPCMGVCDCGDQAMQIADKHGLAISDNRNIPESKLLAPTATTRELELPVLLAYVIGEPEQPDRACFTPLERYCVLLN